LELPIAPYLKYNFAILHLFPRSPRSVLPHDITISGKENPEIPSGSI
jgi:hypothetical protein